MHILLGLIALLGGALFWFYRIRAAKDAAIDVADAAMQADFDGLKLGSTPILQMRSASRDGDDLRVVLDLKANVKPRSFVLQPILQYGDRLVVDLYTADQQVAPVVQKARRVTDVHHLLFLWSAWRVEF